MTGVVVVSYIQPDGLFDEMYQYIHVDEKKFYLKTHKSRVYLLTDEEPP